MILDKPVSLKLKENLRRSSNLGHRPLGDHSILCIAYPQLICVFSVSVLPFKFLERLRSQLQVPRYVFQKKCCSAFELYFFNYMFFVNIYPNYCV